MKIAETVTYGGSGLDRAAADRGDVTQARLRALPEAVTLLFWAGKPLLVRDEESGGYATARLPLTHPALERDALTLFLGRDGAAPVFAQELAHWAPDDLSPTHGAFEDPARERHPLIAPGAFTELRTAMTRMSARGAELCATARGLFEWHRLTAFCGSCGGRTRAAEAGWQRHCPDCGRRHFPRSDPVAIMLVTRGNSVLLGRAPGWPDGMYSLLAGFVEPGETVEAAARREVWEEVGVRIGDVSYLASQPWPFPASLMIGCHAQAITDELHPDRAEIEDAIWLTREELAASFAGRHPVAPARPGAIAHFLLRNWLADRLD